MSSSLVLPSMIQWNNKLTKGIKTEINILQTLGRPNTVMIRSYIQEWTG